MIPIWLAILLWFASGFVGLFVAALLCAAGRADDCMEQIERRAKARQGGDQQ